jgi:predicted RNA-binding Zn-ribbon protein involved in translation (DUF1610 family)
MKKNDYIEILCPSCGGKNQLHFNDSFQNRELRCSHCSAHIYWHHCPECETGFYDDNKNSQCPECHPVVSPKSPSAKKPFLSKPCPWCGWHINYLKIGLKKNNIHQCPNCGKYFEETEILKSVLSILLLMFAFAIVADSTVIAFLKSRLPEIILAPLLAIIMFIGAVLVLYFTRGLKRMK